MTNRLAAEPSPYLRQHSENPVDWYPWGAEAFEKARLEDKPIFLSIGYSACHWCHVMERESFEDEGIARFLNESFVSIKVDREERPDVDDVYMTCVQLTTGSGGWPLTAFLLPDRRPFFGGTYFPPRDRGGRPGFETLLARIAVAFREQRAELEATAGRIAEGMEEGNNLTVRFPRKPLSKETLEKLVPSLTRSFDERHGGFGNAPKFPPHMALGVLLDRAEAGEDEARRMALFTLEAMALGGIHDHLGGGFHRYSTDAYWLVPHFEKMLTDNAQLLAVFARGVALSGRAFFERTARGIAEYLLSEMRGPEGAFTSATDADSEGEEGKYFVWTETEIRALLGDAGASFFGSIYQVRPEGNFVEEASGLPTGSNILHLRVEPSEEEERRLGPLQETLLKKRRQRVPPGLDDKRLAGWNALTVSGLAVAGRALNEPRYLAAAGETARFLLQVQRDSSGRLLRSWKDGEGRIPAFLEDEAFLANALLDLAEAEAGDAARAWSARAREAVEGFRRFRHPGGSGFTFSGEGNERLMFSGRDLFDKAIPSGPASAVRALLRVALRDGDAGLAREGRAALEEVSGLMDRAPHGTETWHQALSLLFDFEERFGPSGKASESVDVADRSLEVGEAGPVRAEASLPSARVVRGSGVEVGLELKIRTGYSLAGREPLAVEAWGGKDITLTRVDLPEPAPLVHEDGTSEPGYEGTVRARLFLSVGPEAALGRRLLSVLVRFTACGEGACLPATAVSLSLPLTIE